VGRRGLGARCVPAFRRLWAAGKVKEAAGKATGSEKLQAEGLAQRAKGKGEKLAGDAKQAGKDATNQVADAANKKL
jgi:uncharacterized protein YjbJ (UPF0337 family)